MRRPARPTVLALALTVLTASSASARDFQKIKLEIGIDGRAILADRGKERLALHSASVRVSAPLAPRTRAEAYGSHQYIGFRVQEAVVEQDLGTARLRGGLVRVPFGIYDIQETYASGLIDYPLARGDYAFNSVDWGAPGVYGTVGNGRTQVEAAAFNGRAAGIWSNTDNIGGLAARVQTYAKDLILGASHWNGTMDLTAGAFGMGRLPVRLNGIDLRYTRPHLLMRGEYLFGTLAGDAMHGGYLDLYYHLPRFERWTLVARAEGYRAESHEPYARQLTLGARYTVSRDLVAAVNWRSNNTDRVHDFHWTVPATGRGSLLFQLFYKLRL